MHNKFLGPIDHMTADYFLKKDLIFIVFDGVEIMLEYNGNVGTHIDVFVRSNSKTFDDAWTLFMSMSLHIFKHFVLLLVDAKESYSWRGLCSQSV